MNPKADASLRGLSPVGLLQVARHTSSSTGLWWEAPAPAELAAQFPGFVLERLLGRGGMSAVYLAHQPSLHRQVAIKVLPPELSVDPERVERFRREARTLARLHHENIVEIHDAGTSPEGWIFFVMEFVPGPDLGRRLAQGSLTPAEAVVLLEQICHALEYAHAQGVIHRDVKPTNVLLTAAGRVKVADFGVASLVEDEPRARSGRLTRTGMSLGTLEYAAPEQVHGVGSDQRSDVFSLGVMAYELLTGELPRGAFDPPSRRSPVDPGFDAVVLRALGNDPARRWPTVRQFREALMAAHETALLVGTMDMLGSSQAEVIERFYGEAVAGVPPVLREFVEDQLLTEAGYRDSRALDQALGLPGVTPEAIQGLVDRRLLRVDGRGGTERVEISHERLLNAVRASRDARREREREQRAAAEARRQRESLRRRTRLVVSFALFALVAAGAAVFGLTQQQRALKREAEVTFHRDRAESLVNFMLDELRTNLMARQDYDVLRQILAKVDDHYREMPPPQDLSAMTNRIYFYEQKLLILRFQGRYDEEIPVALEAERLTAELERRGVRLAHKLDDELPRQWPFQHYPGRPDGDPP